MSGLIADRFGSYRPAFYMVGGAFAAAALIPSILYCVKNKEIKRRELLPSDKENTDAQEFKEQSLHCERGVDEPSKTTHDCRKLVMLGHELFVSTV